MATETSQPLTVDRSPSDHLGSLSIHDRTSSGSQRRLGGNFSADQRTRSGVELSKLRQSFDSSEGRNYGGRLSGDHTRPHSARAASFAEPSASKPPSGSKHRRAKSSLNLQKVEVPSENGGFAEYAQTPSPQTQKNGRTRSSSFSKTEITPRSPDSTGRRTSESFRQYTREEKGKETAYKDRRNLVSGPRQYSASQPSSRASSPGRSERLLRDSPITISRASSQPQRTSSGYMSSSMLAPKLPAPDIRDVQRVLEDLESTSTDKQIRALRRIQLDAQIIKELATNEKAIDLVVKCVKPAKSWLPQLGCTDLQFHAVVAARHLASYANVRQKILEREGQLPLIHLLKTGSAETQSHVARTLAYLAEHPDGSYKIGRDGGCVALVQMLPSRAGLTNTYVSVQMAVDHDAAQANAALALANLADATGNQQKMVEAGAIVGLILCLSPGIAAVQASAAKCLHKLAKDVEYHELIVQGGALAALLQLLSADDTEPDARAAAVEAVGGVINSERMAADTIPHLVAMAKSDALKVKLAATRALAELASKSKFNRTKIAEEVEGMPAIVEQLKLADMQHKLTRAIESRCSRESPLGLVARLRDTMGEASVRLIQTILQQMDMSLSSLDCETLTKAFRENAYDHERAAIRLLQSLSLRGFSQSRVLQFKADIIWKVARLIRSEVRSIRSKALSCLASLSMQIPDFVQRELRQDAFALVNAHKDPATKSQALRLVLNLATNDIALEWLVEIGLVNPIIGDLANSNPEIQFLASSCLANMTTHRDVRTHILESDGLGDLCKLLSSKNKKALAPAAQTLWQLIEDSAEAHQRDGETSEVQLKIAEGIGSLGGAKAAVLILQEEDQDVVEQGTSLIASLAKSTHNAAILAHEGVIGPLVYLLQRGTFSIKASAVEALGYIAAVSNKTRHLIVGPSGASIPTLMSMLDQKDRTMALRAASCLGALSESYDLAAELDDHRLTSTLINYLEDRPDDEEVGRTIIFVLAKHARYSTCFSEVWHRLHGVDILSELTWLSRSERERLANTLHSLASAPDTPLSPQTPSEDEAERLEGGDHFDQELPLSTKAIRTSPSS